MAPLTSPTSLHTLLSHDPPAPAMPAFLFQGHTKSLLAFVLAVPSARNVLPPAPHTAGSYCLPLLWSGLLCPVLWCVPVPSTEPGAWRCSVNVCQQRDGWLTSSLCAPLGSGPEAKGLPCLPVSSAPVLSPTLICH